MSADCLIEFWHIPNACLMLSLPTSKYGRLYKPLKTHMLMPLQMSLLHTKASDTRSISDSLIGSISAEGPVHQA